MSNVRVQDVIPYPDELAKEYRKNGYWINETMGDLLTAAAKSNPTRVCVKDYKTELSVSDIAESAEYVSGWLTELGVDPGDRVVVFMPNVVEYLEILFGIFHRGAIPVFALSAHRQTELVHVSKQAGAKLLITVDRLGLTDFAAIAADTVSRLPELQVAVVPHDGSKPWRNSKPSPVPSIAEGSDLAFLQLSGGTTGSPKLIPRTHDDYLYSVRESAKICGLRAGDVMLVVLPCSHNFTMSSPGMLGALWAGVTIVMAPDPSPATCLELIQKEKVTQVALVPPLLISWLNSGFKEEYDLSSLRTVWVGGARLNREVAKRVNPELGCQLQQVFGMAEGLVCYTRLDDEEDTIINTQGRPISPADELLVVDNDGQPVPAGEVGSLLTRGPYTIRGYYRSPEHNARSFTSDGYYITGDLVHLDDRGYISVDGRLKDIINRGGEKIAPEAVENELVSHPLVHDASLVGIPDKILGEKTLAYVIVRAGVTEEEKPSASGLRQHLRKRGVAAFCVPDEFSFVDAFPQTGVGKVSKAFQRKQ